MSPEREESPAVDPKVDHSDSPIGRGALAAAMGTGASRITGFLRIMAIVYTLGVVENKLADTYQLANDTPTQLYELVLGGLLSSALFRMYIEVRDTQGAEEAWVFITRVTKVALALLTAVSVIGVVAAPLVMKLYTLGSTDPTVAFQRRAGTLLFQLLVPQLIFYGFSTISTAVLQAHRRVGVFSFVPVLNNITVIATMFVFARTVHRSDRLIQNIPDSALMLLGIGTTAGVALLGLTPFLYMRSTGWRFVRRAGWRDPRFGRLLTHTAYILGYVATNQLGVWVAQYLANKVQGGVAGYKSAFQFFQLPHGLFAVSIAVVVITGLAESGVARDFDQFARQLSRGLRGIIFLLLPMIAGYIALAPQVVRLLLEHGVATQASTHLISTVLRAWAPGILFFSLFYLVVRGFYQLGDFRTPMFVNLGAFALNVVIDVVLFNVLADPTHKIAGLAVGHAVSYVFAASVCFLIIRRRVGPLVSEGLAKTALKSLVAATATGAASWLTIRASTELFGPGVGSQALAVSLATLAGLLIYLSASWILRTEEMDWITKLLRR